MDIKTKSLDEYLAEEDVDFDYTSEQVPYVMIKLPNLHSKWLRYLTFEKISLINRENKLTKLYKDKYEHFRTNKDLLIDTKHIDYYILSDDEYVALSLQVDIRKKIISHLEEVIKRIKNMHYTLPKYIDWKRFELGN